MICSRSARSSPARAHLRAQPGIWEGLAEPCAPVRPWRAYGKTGTAEGEASVGLAVAPARTAGASAAHPPGVADSQRVIMVIPIARMSTTLADYLRDQPPNLPRPVYQPAALST